MVVLPVAHLFSPIDKKWYSWMSSFFIFQGGLYSVSTLWCTYLLNFMVVMHFVFIMGMRFLSPPVYLLRYHAKNCTLSQKSAYFILWSSNLIHRLWWRDFQYNWSGNLQPSRVVIPWRCTTTFLFSLWVVQVHALKCTFSRQVRYKQK